MHFAAPWLELEQVKLIAVILENRAHLMSEIETAIIQRPQKSSWSLAHHCKRAGA